MDDHDRLRWDGYPVSVGVPEAEWGDGAYIEDPEGLRPGINCVMADPEGNEFCVV